MRSPFSVVLYSGTLDRYHEAVVFCAAARARGDTALLFLRGPALKAFVERLWTPAPDPALQAGLDRFPPSPEDLLGEVRAKGGLRVYACSAWARMLDLDAAAVAARVDAVVGLNAFLSQAAGGPVLYL